MKSSGGNKVVLKKKTNWFCDDCKVSFTMQKNLKAHQKRFHEPLLLRYVCQLCDQKCNVAYNLQQHYRAAHPSLPNPDIEVCIAYTRNTRSGIVFY